MDERRRRFCQAIVGGAAKQDAAVEAGYSPRTAPSIASQLLRNPAIKKEIARLREELDAKVASDDERKLKDHYDSSLDLIRDVYNNPKLPFSVRVQAAKEALPYEHGKIGPKGKKNDIKETALEVASGGGKGKYAPGSKPQLRAVS